MWLSAAQCKTETNWRKLESQRDSGGFHCSCLLLYFSINAHHSFISQPHPSPSWGPGRRNWDSSLPKIVLPLHFLAQAHQVHHCSACSHDKVMQHPVLSELFWKEPRGNDLSYVHLHRNSSPFSHPWCWSLCRPCLSPGMQTSGFVRALSNMECSAQISKWSVMC